MFRVETWRWGKVGVKGVERIELRGIAFWVEEEGGGGGGAVTAEAGAGA